MTPLRAQMIAQRQLQRFAPSTQDVYVRAVAGLGTYYGRSPAQLTSDEIRAYLHHLLVERQLAWSTCNVITAAIRFLSVDTLGCPLAELNLPPRPMPII